MARRNASKRGEDSGKFIDKSWKDAPTLAQIRVIPEAEKCSSKVLLIVKFLADRVS